MKMYIIQRLRDDLYYGGHRFYWYPHPAHAKLYKNAGTVKLGLYHIGNKRVHESAKEFLARIDNEYRVYAWDIGEPNYAPVPPSSLVVKK